MHRHGNDQQDPAPQHTHKHEGAGPVSGGRAKKGKTEEGVRVDDFSWRMAKEAVGLLMSYLKGLAQNHIGSGPRSGEWSDSGQRE